MLEAECCHHYIIVQYLKWYRQYMCHNNKQTKFYCKVSVKYYGTVRYCLNTNKQTNRLAGIHWSSVKNMSYIIFHLLHKFIRLSLSLCI
jgi:hypothetical protein